MRMNMLRLKALLPRQGRGNSSETPFSPGKPTPTVSSLFELPALQNNSKAMLLEDAAGIGAWHEGVDPFTALRLGVFAKRGRR